MKSADGNTRNTDDKKKILIRIIFVEQMIFKFSDVA